MLNFRFFHTYQYNHPSISSEVSLSSVEVRGFDLLCDQTLEESVFADPLLSPSLNSVPVVSE